MMKIEVEPGSVRQYHPKNSENKLLLKPADSAFALKGEKELPKLFVVMSCV